VAARLANVPLELTAVDAGLQQLQQRMDLVFYEGIGGILVPLNESMLSMDHARKYTQTAVVIARNSLGTINHTALTIRVLQQNDFQVSRLYLSHARPQAPDAATPGSGAIFFGEPWPAAFYSNRWNKIFAAPK